MEGKMRTEQEIKWYLEAIHRDMKLAEHDVKSKDIELSEFAIEQLKELSIKERILMWVMNGE
jgi:HEPN domain-containing protein